MEWQEDLKSARIDHIKFICKNLKNMPVKQKDMVYVLCRHVLDLLNLRPKEYLNYIREITDILDN